MKALVDFVGITFRAESGPQVAFQFLEAFVRQHLGAEVEITDTGRGWSGYQQRYDIPAGGLIAVGGNGDTCHVELTGTGCALVADWDEFAADVEAFRGKLTRVDVAADDFEGAAYSIEWCRQQYNAGGFKPSRGMAPKAHCHSDEGSGAGSTYYVGSRDSGKLFRGYEKGKQSGDPESSWFRLEVEYRAVHRELPVQMLTNPCAYLAGSYPCLSELSIEQSRPLTVAYTSAAMLEKAIDHAKKQAGRVLHAVLTLNGGDIGAALSRIYRPELPKRLAASVLALVSGDENEASHGRHMRRAWLRAPTFHESAALERARSLERGIWRHRRLVAGGVPVGMTSL